MKPSCRVALTVLFVIFLASMSVSVPAFGQEQAQAVAPPRPLITAAIDESRLATLKGNTHPLARPEFDLGTAPASLPMQRMLLVLKRSDDQETSLRKLLDDQQDKNSPNYHKWMTPEQFGAQYGPTDADMQTITSWLQSHGFEVGSTKGRTVLEFTGSASQVQEAFHTSIHKYMVNGEQHWANAGDPQIPAALAPAVAGISSLNNFPRKPLSRVLGAFSGDKTTGQIQPVEPVYTLPTGCVQDPSSNTPCFYGVSPYDFATIYDVLPLWNAGIKGNGQTIAIVGETNVNIQDVRDFRTLFGLPANDPQIILNGPDPGIVGDEVEANLDLQWSGAVAPNATIKFVASASTETTFGVDLSAVYIVENNLAPVMSESYGLCELALGTAGNQFYNSLWQQAAAQGITVFISAGDAGSAGCDNFNAQSPAPARFGLQVSGFASTPYNVAVGGTDFNDFLNPSTYWNLTNSTTQASAKGYIPEVPWNGSCTNPIFGQIGYSTNPETNCNDYRIYSNFDVPLGGSGGASNCTTSDGSTTSSCSGGYAKPSWQTGTGVPNDGKRDIPDVSLFASSGFLGNFYMMCEADQTPGPCSLAPNYYFLAIGGTSASSPAFAGIMALVNQKTGERQGNANYILYKLAAQQPTAFHDITSGTIAMPCATNSPNCTTSNPSDFYGVLTGYAATSKYDLATGLGTVDVNNLVTKWSSVTLLPSATTLSSLTPTTITHGQSVNFTVSVAPASGTGTPTGLISLQGGPTNSTGHIAGFSLTNGTVSGTTELLSGGTYSVTAHYPGDSTYGASDSSPITVTVSKENSQPQAYLVTFDSGGHVVSGDTNTAIYGSPYILRVDVANSSGAMCSPMAASGATGCPSGTVTLANNGSPLDAGTYPLNSYGYVEDLAVQLPGGTNSVQVNYSGDDSFNTKTITSSISISKASTGVNPPTVQNYVVGSVFTASALVQSLGSGAAPTGTVTFYSNGSPIAGTTTYQGGTQTGSNPVAWLTANFTSSASAFPTPGNYTITATYSGDGNYTGSTSSGTGIWVMYPSPAISITPSQQLVQYLGIANVTALVDTTNKANYPTGAVNFVAQTGAVLAVGVPCTSTTDSSGNFACQATASFQVTSSVSISAVYSGDTYYPFTSSSPSAIVNMPDFAISSTGSQFTVTQGQSQNVPINITASNGFTGNISYFACAGPLPAETTCSFNPTQVNGSGSTTLTITTTPLGQSRLRRAANNRPAFSWTTGSLLLIGICLIAAPGARRRLPLLMAIGLAILLPSCGGGSSGGGGGTTNPTPSISSLSPSSVAAQSALPILVINGANFMPGVSTVNFGVGGGTRPVNQYNGTTQLSIGLSIGDLSSTATYPVTVTNPGPGGGTSAPVNFNVVTGTPTGSFQIDIVAQSGQLAHQTTITLVVQ